MSETPLSQKVPPIPKGLTCMCGTCDLRTIRYSDVAEAVHRLKDRGFIAKDGNKRVNVVELKDIDEIFGNFEQKEVMKNSI